MAFPWLFSTGEWGSFKVFSAGGFQKYPKTEKRQKFGRLAQKSFQSTVRVNSTCLREFRAKITHLFPKITIVDHFLFVVRDLWGRGDCGVKKFPAYGAHFYRGGGGGGPDKENVD